VAEMSAKDISDVQQHIVHVLLGIDGYIIFPFISSNISDNMTSGTSKFRGSNGFIVRK
jgi:hypothetical protein